MHMFVKYFVDVVNVSVVVLGYAGLCVCACVQPPYRGVARTHTALNLVAARAAMCSYVQNFCTLKYRLLG